MKLIGTFFSFVLIYFLVSSPAQAQLARKNQQSQQNQHSQPYVAPATPVQPSGQMQASQPRDTTKLGQVVEQVKKWGEAQPVEKVYLHFDKPYYAVADTMWFKAYVTVEQAIPSPFSKIVYVDIFNSTDSLVKSLKLPLKNSVAYGNIPIGMRDFKQGNYYVRAYTLWMLNFDDAYFFYKNIPIGEAIDKELITHINWSNESVNKVIKTNARIQFKGMDKKNLANKTVTWTIYSAGDVVSKGKGSTDANGFITVSVSRKEEERIDRGHIVTTVSLNDKETATARFTLKQESEPVDVQFFPEGGTLIAGIPNQVAVKALQPNGLGSNYKGSILNSENQEIAPINAGFAGMGSFYINPEPGKSYQARLIFKDGSTKTYPIPPAVDKGISLQVVNQTATQINARVLANNSFLADNQGKNYFIVAQNNGVVCIAANMQLNAQVVNVKIPKAGLPSGILQITLFSAEKVPLSERLAFVMPEEAIHLTAKTDLPAYKTRQHVKMSIQALASTQPVEGDFSVSVVDEQKVPSDENNETSILSSLLLQSDLKGYIEKPNYYFTKTDDQKLADLDKLMLTQGYRRFVYTDILADKFPAVTMLPEQGINLSGTLRDLTGMPIRKGTVQMMVTGKPVSSSVITSNTGVFNFQNLSFPDSSEVVINARYNPNPANLMLIMDGMPFASGGRNKNSVDALPNIDTALSAYLNNSQKQYRYLHTLKTVEIKGSTPVRVSHTDHSNLTGLGNADHVIDATAFSSCGSLLLECLKTQLTGLTYDNEKFYVSRDYNAGARTPVQVFLNNFPIEAIEINNINAAELESVEVFLSDPLGTVDRAYGTKGVLVINTKKQAAGTKISKQALMDMIPKKNILTIHPMGYSKEREFYSPKYLPNAAITSSDLRSTIYWNPRVVTDTQGLAQFDFFTADGKGNYRVTIEGFDKEGRLGRFVYHFKVN